MGKHIDRGGALDLLVAAATPAALAAPGEIGIASVLAPHSPRLAETLPTKIVAALQAQTVVVPGTAEFGRVIAGVAAQLRDVRAERAALAADLKARLEAHPLSGVLTSTPGVGIRTSIKILPIVGDGSAFPPPDTSPPTPDSPPSPADPGPPSAARPVPSADTMP